MISTLRWRAAGAWSNARPGVFFTARQDGALDVWDLHFKHGAPCLTAQVASEPLTCLSNTQARPRC